MKAVIYTRTSWDETDNPRESNSTQESACRKKATENDDEIAKLYSDINKSGTAIAHRKDFVQMLKDIKPFNIERVYTLNLSRFARDLIDQETSIKDLQKKGVSVFTCDDGLVQDKTTFFRQIKGAYNQELIRVMREQTKVEHETRLAKMIPVSRPPMGYKINSKTKKWDVDEKKSDIVRRIFEMKSSGNDLKTISKETKVIIPTLKHILKNKSYLGIYTYREQSFASHDPIISAEVFEKCQI